MTKLVMTEKEILREYTEALDPQGQIKILADLNLTDKGTIRKVLRRNGIDLPEEPKRIKKEWKAPVVCVNAEDIHDKSKIMEIINRQAYKSVLDCEKAVDLYLQGKCDREIGAAFIRTKQNVRYWRKTRGLPTLLKSKKQNADKSVRAKKRDVV